MQTIAFWDYFLNFYLGFIMPLESTTNPSEKLKMIIWSTKNSIRVDDYNDFPTSNTFFIIKLQTFGGRIFEVHFAG